MGGKVKVGFPRGLFYYEYFPFWKNLIEAMGGEVIVSGPTNQDILNAGVKATVDEACLPVKIFHGHLLDLQDKADCLFVPRLVSMVKKEYICPKFCGLPDIIRHGTGRLPPIIDVEVNSNKFGQSLFVASLKVGNILKQNPLQVWRAYHQAVQAQNSYQKLLQQGHPLPELLEGKRNFSVLKPGEEQLTIAVLGHAYNVYDSYVNMDLFAKMRRKGIKVITLENLPTADINQGAAVLPKKMFWTFGRNAVGGLVHLIKRGEIDGIVSLVSFACGIDSFVGEFMKRRVENIPYLVLTLDEHTGQAGLDTRLEAFIDMVRWRKAG